MSYNLVCFYHSSDSIQLEYLQLVEQSISNLNLNLSIEIQNELDSRWLLYSPRIERFPGFILFRDGAKKSSLIGKYDIESISSWLIFNLS